MDLLAKVNVKVVKVKVKVTFTKAVVKVKVLHQPFGEGGKGGFSLAQTDMVLPTTQDFHHLV